MLVALLVTLDKEEGGLEKLDVVIEWPRQLVLIWKLLSFSSKLVYNLLLFVSILSICISCMIVSQLFSHFKPVTTCTALFLYWPWPRCLPWWLSREAGSPVSDGCPLLLTCVTPDKSADKKPILKWHGKCSNVENYLANKSSSGVDTTLNLPPPLFLTSAPAKFVQTLAGAGLAVMGV